MDIDALNKQFVAIYEADSDAIFRFCLLRVSDRELAVDLTQETFARLWQSLKNGGDMTNVRAFIFTIAHRLVIDWYRKKKSLSIESMANPETGESYDEPDPVALQNIVEGGEGRRLIESIDKLGSSYRDAVYLRFVEDLSPPEIGKILGISANAVSVRINRGLNELRKITGFGAIEYEHE